MKKGQIGVTSENIFPIIKKFLYSEQEIFLRELISNAVDATQKIKALSSKGVVKGDLGDLTIRVKVDKDKKTITISDQGLGMTAEEIEKYINQIAFTGANDFLEKYKDKIENIIGHFGLGFYSSFMVSKNVEIITKSYQKDSKAAKWSCDGSPNYTIEDAKKETRGTDIILYIDDESKEYLEDSKITELLNKYCKFLPIEIGFGSQKETKEVDGKKVDTDKDTIINDINPTWRKKPADLKDKDYQEFYKKLYPASYEEPLFQIHLNVDYPFNLTGILYFPRLRTNLEIQKNKIQLYSNQVFVTDSVENIVPEHLTLLHGVLDSPDIPLNVSRSYLQTDVAVKKIASHINKKVTDKLSEIFKNKRDDFEKKWDDLKMFIQYGIITDQKFYDRAKDFYLIKNMDGKYFTTEEYKKIVTENQTDQEKKVIFLYATNQTEQYSFIEAAKTKGYDVLIMDGQLDSHFIQQVEQKLDNIKFARVDSDTIDNLIRKDAKKDTGLTKTTQDELSPVYEAQTSQDVGSFWIQFEALSKDELPVVITQSEHMRRMKEMGKLGGPEVNLYNNLPNHYNLVVNTTHPITKQIIDDKDKTLGEELKKINEELKPVNSDIEALEKLSKDKKEEEIPQEEKDKKDSLQKKINDLEGKKTDILKKYGKDNKLVKQVIDLALLANNLLKGEDLTKFVKRSVSFIEK